MKPHSLQDDVVATVALALFSAAVAAGFARVFSGWAFFDNLLLIVVFGHGAALVMRRIRWQAWIAVPVLAIGLTWLIGAMYYRETYRLLLPTSDTWALFRVELDLVGEQFRTAVAPVSFLGGWDVLATIGIAAVVLLADTFAFRAYARAEALVPGGVLFVFIAALGTDRDRVALTMLLVAAGVLATVALRFHHTGAAPASIGRRQPLGARAPLALGTAIVIAIAAGFLGPRIPGANAEPLYDTNDGGGGSVTEVLSPLVDIRSRLTNRSTSELFVVDATSESYWRSSALPKFDGTTWGLPERSVTNTDGALSAAPSGATEIRQQLRIVNLSGRLVPAAANPVAAKGPDDTLRWNPDSATLVQTGRDLTRGDVFDIVSASPRYSANDLLGATSNDPGDPIYFELPADFPPSVAETTRDITAGSTSTYDAALTLQNWFRSEFDYSLEIQAGHGTNAIEAFLRDRVGYCEQFAGTYAAMMRSIGIPARVAVGFTPGTDNSEGSYSVLGRNAHAWPEVWFDGFGWVPFEPTPGRGAPGAEDHTGVAAQQDDSPVTAGDDVETGDGDGDDTSATTVPVTTVPAGDTTVTTLAPGADPGSSSGADPDLGEPVPVNADEDEPASSVPWLQIGLVVAVIAALFAPAVVRRVRRRRVHDTGRAVARYWDRALDAVGEVGVATSPHQTPAESAQTTADAFPVAARPIQSLAGALTSVVYAPARTEGVGVDEPKPTVLSDCANWCRQIERAVYDSMTPQARVRRYFTHWV